MAKIWYKEKMKALDPLHFQNRHIIKKLDGESQRSTLVHLANTSLMSNLMKAMEYQATSQLKKDSPPTPVAL